MTNAALSPVERLVLTRERLRLALQGADDKPPSTDAPGVSWLGSLADIPGAGALIAAATRWWAQHRLRLVGKAISDTAKAVVQPLAQRHPLALVLGALLLGGLLAWSRPWRWFLTPALFAGLLPRLLATLLEPQPPKPAPPPAT